MIRACIDIKMNQSRRTYTNNNIATNNNDTLVKAIVPDGGWGWIVCGSCFFGNMAVGGIMLTFGIILPTVRNFFDSGTFSVSLIGSTMIGLTYGIAPLAASLTNRLGIRGVYMIGSLVAFVSFFASAFSSNVYLLILFFGFSGLGLGLMLMPVSVACNLYFEKKRALATGVAKTGFSVGGFVLPFVIYLILEDFDWRGVVWVYGITAFASCVIGSFIKPLELVISGDPNVFKKNHVFPKHSEDFIKIKQSMESSNSISETMEIWKNLANMERTEQIDIIKSNSSDKELPPISYIRDPRLQRRLSIIQLENIKEDLKKEEVKSTEFVFKPNAPEGSKLFLPALARHDSFYDGSLANLFGPMSSTNKNVSSALDALSGQIYSIVSMSVFDEIERKETLKDKLSGLVAVAKSWENLPIAMLFISRFFGNFSMTIFFIELPSIIVHNGFSMWQATVVLTTIGIANSVSRIFIGTVVMDHPNVDSCLLTGVAFFFQGMLLCVLPFTFQYEYLLAYGVIIGVSNSPYWVGLSIALGRMVPLKKVAPTCGFMSIAQGLGSFVGPPIAGLVFDATGSYSLIIYIIAIGYLISGISCCAAAYAHKNQIK